MTGKAIGVQEGGRRCEGAWCTARDAPPPHLTSPLEGGGMKWGREWVLGAISANTPEPTAASLALPERVDLAAGAA